MFLEVLGGLAALTVPSQSAQGQDCRAVPTNVGGRMVQKTMCRGADGQWRELINSSAPTGGPLAPNFRGSVTYKGDYQGVAQKPVRRNNRLSLNSLLDSGERYNGTSTVVLEFDGNLVTGTIESVSAGRTNRVKLSGTRQGNQCSLFDNDGGAHEGICDAGSFRGRSQSGPSARISWKADFNTAAVATVDFVERDRRNAVARAEAEAKAKADREAALAERVRLRASLPKGALARYKPMLDSAVTRDSAHWFMNRYASGSIDLVGVKNDPSGAIFLKAYFQYTSGNEGWVGAIVQNNQIQCLQFWDDPSGCRGIGNGLNAKLGQSFVEGMLSSGPSNGSRSNEYPESCGLVVTGTNAAGGAVYGGRC